MLRFAYTNAMMNVSRKLPIGVQSFEDLREKNFLYVDKTTYIFRLVNANKVYFLSRPHRFGKSLFLSTLKAYFLGQKELFKGLYLEKAEEELAMQENRNAWQEYPVLYFDFNTENYSDQQSLHSLLHTHLSQWEKLYGADNTEQTFSSRFKGIIERACAQTGKQVVILVDEYDKPLLQTMGINEALNDEYRNMLKAFYSVIKSCDQYIRFAFLTGVTKFSKISIFSDLNNLRDISLEEDYAGICGITQTELEDRFQPEIQLLAQRQQTDYEHTLVALKQWYDGYRFYPMSEGLYNPSSVLSAFAKREIKSYWFSTGTPTFLVNYLKEAYYYIPDLDGNVKLNESGLETYRAVAQDTLPILFQSGYLTIKGYIKEARMYRLGFPNNEVRYGFLENLLPAYSGLAFVETGVSVWQFVEDIRKSNVDGFMERMQAIIAGIPYDNFSEEKVNLREQNYQTAVYLIFALMGQFVQTEIHCYSSATMDGGCSTQKRCFDKVETRSQNYTRTYSFDDATGRADCIVHTADAVYIFEFKLTGNGTADDAINQIKEKNYTMQYTVSGKKIILIGAGFDELAKTIKDWKTELL